MLTRRSTLALTLPWPLAPRALAATPLKVVADIEPPFVLKPQHAMGAGMDVDIAREALQLGGGPGIELEIVPFRRGLIMVEQGDADLTLGLVKTPDREPSLAFSRPYGHAPTLQFLSATQGPAMVQRLADLRSLRVGLLLGAKHPAALQAALGATPSYINSRTSLLRMAAVGRLDVVVMERLTARWLMRELQLDQQLKAQPFELPWGSSPCMAFSRKSAAGMAALAPMNRGLEMLEQSGWAQFEKRYRV